MKNYIKKLTILFTLLLTTFVNIAARNPFIENTSLATKQYYTRIILHYRHADDISKLINQKNGLLSKTGHLIVDARDNQLWINDNKKHIKQIISIIHQIDIPISQILIHTKIIRIDNQAVQSLGLNFTSSNQQDTDKTDGLTFDLSSGLSATAIDTATIPVVKLLNATTLQLKIAALQQQGFAHFIATPHIITNNRQTAVIESGQEIPYQEKTGEGNTSVTFKQAALRLKVTPELLPHQHILLNLHINQDQVSDLQVNGVPAINTQQLSTHVLLKNKQTMVLGGIYEHRYSRSKAEIPFIGKIPLLGWLFRQKQQRKQRQQLLILVTPEIIQ